MTRPTLRLRIRDIVDAAERRLAQPEIYAKLLQGGAVDRNTFCVTVAQMLGDRQLDRRKATKVVHAATGGRFVYGPGRKPVEDRERSCTSPGEVRRLHGTEASARCASARSPASGGLMLR